MGADCTKHDWLPHRRCFQSLLCLLLSLQAQPPNYIPMQAKGGIVEPGG